MKLVFELVLYDMGILVKAISESLEINYSSSTIL